MLSLVSPAVVACAYRSAVGRLGPASKGTLFIGIPHVGRLDEPALSPQLRRALARRLVVRNAHLVARRDAADIRLETRVLSLQRELPAIVGRRTASEDLVLRLEAWLTGASGKTLWRSGLVVARVQSAVPAVPAAAEDTRRKATRVLADRAAAAVVSRLSRPKPVSSQRRWSRSTLP